MHDEVLLNFRSYYHMFIGTAHTGQDLDTHCGQGVE